MPLLFNQDVAMLYVEPDKADEHFYRNAQADEIVYVCQGEGTLETQYGDLPFREGDYLVIHRGIMHRYRFDDGGDKPKLADHGRAAGTSRPPKRYRNEFGQLIEGAPYSERDIRVRASSSTHDEKGDFRILVKQYDGINEIVLDHHPLDVVGLGRIVLSVGLQHQGLRADRRPGAPAAAGAPDLPGRRLRRLLVLPAPVRLPSRSDAGAVQPQQRGFGRGALLRLERVHEPQGNRVRLASRTIRTAFRTARIRGAPRRRSARSTPTSWR